MASHLPVLDVPLLYYSSAFDTQRLVTDFHVHLTLLVRDSIAIIMAMFQSMLKIKQTELLCNLLAIFVYLFVSNIGYITLCSKFE